MTKPQPLWKVVLAWCVHFYTALGLVAAAGIAVLLVRGGEGDYPLCFALMFAATIIDATDGTLARAIRVKEVLPGFDGRRLDDLIDFLTYTALPVLLVWRAGLVPEGWGPVLLLPLLASAYGFCQTHAKTEDGFFLGFPSYWNLMAFYFYVLRMPGWLVVALAVLFAVLTFVPSRYLYPTQRGRLNMTTNVLGAGWAVLLVWILFVLVREGEDGTGKARAIALWSLYFPAYYLLTSWWVSLRIWRRKRARGVRPATS